MSDLCHIHFLAKPRLEKRFDKVRLFLESFLSVPDEFEPGLGVGVQCHSEVVEGHLLSPSQCCDGRIDVVDKILGGDSIFCRTIEFLQVRNGFVQSACFAAC